MSSQTQTQFAPSVLCRFCSTDNMLQKRVQNIEKLKTRHMHKQQNMKKDEERQTYLRVAHPLVWQLARQQVPELFLKAESMMNK